MKIAIVGEAYGEEEAKWERPFIGAAGQELNRMLADAGIKREECYVTNVFNFQPKGNDIETLCTNKSSLPRDYEWPSLVKGKYLLPELLSEVHRLRSELAYVQPNVVVALGNTATWALCRLTSISKIRGAVRESTLVPGLKVLPTYHPEAVLRQYDLRPVTVMDLAKAKVQSEFKEIRRPIREVWLDPTLSDIDVFRSKYILGSTYCAADIETAMGQITCIGFAPSIERAIVIPFADMRKPGNSYWPTLRDECQALDYVANILGLPQVRIIGQNFMYDLKYLWPVYGIPVPRFAEDTMLLHHALQPESEKGLAFLGSVYTDELAWKTMRPRGKHSLKREE